jgi:dihydroorotate dehydrogenase (NAD+) catalytic subunit
MAPQTSSDRAPQGSPDLGVEIAGVAMATPLLPASGTCGYAREYGDFLDLGHFGAMVTKSITLKPRTGNDYPRVVETRAGMLNAIGLANVGLEAFLRDKAPLLRELGLPVFVNVAGSAIEEYVAVVEALEGEPAVRGVELNISCPNVKAGGMQFGVDPAQVKAVVSAARAVCRKNILIVKLSPNVADIAATAGAAVEAGADALSLINTFTAMAIDVEKRRPILANMTGGLSGPAIHPVAVHMVHRVHTRVARAAGVPIIAMGGVQYASDALEFFLAGASAVAIGTGLFVDPGCASAILDGIRDYLRRHGYNSIRQIVGALESA